MRSFDTLAPSRVRPKTVRKLVGSILVPPLLATGLAACTGGGSPSKGKGREQSISRSEAAAIDQANKVTNTTTAKVNSEMRHQPTVNRKAVVIVRAACSLPASSANFGGTPAQQDTFQNLDLAYGYLAATHPKATDLPNFLQAAELQRRLGGCPDKPGLQQSAEQERAQRAQVARNEDKEMSDQRAFGGFAAEAEELQVTKPGRGVAPSNILAKAIDDGCAAEASKPITPRTEDVTEKQLRAYLHFLKRQFSKYASDPTADHFHPQGDLPAVDFDQEMKRCPDLGVDPRDYFDWTASEVPQPTPG